MPEIFFNNYDTPVHATSPQSGNPNGYRFIYDINHHSSGVYNNQFSQYLPSASFSPGHSQMSLTSPQNMASPASINTAALLQQQTRYQQQYYQQQHQSASPRHFNFSASNEHENRSNMGSRGSNFGSGSFQRSQTMNSPLVHSPRSDADMTYDQTASYESHQETNMVCQDERDGMIALLTCSMVSPRNGDEGTDVLSEEEDTLFVFSEDDAEKQVTPVASGEQQEQLEEKRAPSMEEIVKSLSCLSEDKSRLELEVEETPLRNNKTLSPVSLADHDVMSNEEGTVDDTADANTLNENLEHAKEQAVVVVVVAKEASPAPKPKKTVTIVEDDHASIVKNATRESYHTAGSITKKRSLLEQAKERDPHADIKPYKPELHIPDDESEASMLVLMRYMGCTPRGYGEPKWIDSSGMPSGRELTFESYDEEDDVTTLSGGTNESSTRGLVKFASTWSVYGPGQEGFELTLDDCLLPSMRLKRSVSLDEGTVMSSSVHGSSTYESAFEDGTKSAECESLVESVDPMAAAMKAVQVATFPRAAALKAETQQREADAPSESDQVEVPEEAVTVTSDASLSKAEVEKVFVAESKASLSRRRKPALTVTTGTSNGSPIEVRTELVKEEDQKTKPASNLSHRVPFPVQPKETDMPSTSIASAAVGIEILSPASEARAFLAAASKSKPQQVEQAEPATSPAAEADEPESLDVASPKEMVLSPVTLGSIVTKDSNPLSPASAARAFLASDSSLISQTASAKKNQVRKPAADAALKLKRRQEVDDLIKAYLSQPQEDNWDKDAFIASVKMNSEPTSGLPKPTPQSQPTPRVNNLTAPSKASFQKVAPASADLSQTKADPPRKKLEPAGVTLEKKEQTKSAMTRLEMKLSRKKTVKPVRTEGSLTDVQIDNSALSPVSAITEGTKETHNTMSLIFKAQAVSSDTRARTTANKSKSSADLLKQAHRVASDKSFTSGSNVRAAIGTIRGDPVAEEPTSVVVTEQAKIKMEEKQVTEKTAFSEEVLNKYRRDIIALKERTQANHRVTAAINRPAVNASGQLTSPEESSSFDKNEVTKEKTWDFVQLRAASLQKTHDKMAELQIAVVSPDDNAREPPPLSPTRESVREVDELLSKTRNWLAQHHQNRHTHVGSTVLTRTGAESMRPSALTMDVPKNVTSPTNPEKSILQELADLKARQMKLSKSRARIGLQ